MRGLRLLGAAALALGILAFAPPLAAQVASASVVAVLADRPDGMGAVQGSGVVVAPGLVATNAHVVRGLRNLRIRREGAPMAASVKCMEAERDLCLLQVPGLPWPPAQLADPTTVAQGLAVEALGWPGGQELSRTTGQLTAVWRYLHERVLETSAACRPGSSGGGLFTLEGRLLGLTTLLVPMGDHACMVIPVEWIQDLLARQGPEGTGLCEDGRPFERAFTDIILEDPANAPRLEALARTWAGSRPGSSGAWNTLAAALVRRLQAGLASGAPDPELLAQCLTACRRATDLDPARAPAWNRAGVALDAAGRLAEAREAFGRAVTLQPTFGLAWLNLGGVLMNLGALPEAAQACRRATTLIPDEPLAFARLAWILARQELPGQAREAYLMALRMRPFVAEWWGELALAEARLGRAEAAREALGRARGLDPELARRLAPRIPH